MSQNLLFSGTPCGWSSGLEMSRPSPFTREDNFLDGDGLAHDESYDHEDIFCGLPTMRIMNSLLIPMEEFFGSIMSEIEDCDNDEADLPW